MRGAFLPKRADNGYTTMTAITGKILGFARKLVCTPLNRLRNRIDAPVIVLVYHRVASLASDPEMLCVTPENFRAQMRHLKENFTLVRFEEVWSAASRPAVCVTFDDGYADNLRQALPILEELRVPATFFVATGTVDSSGEFWWDAMKRIILERQDLPGSFILRDGSRQRSWPTQSAAQRQRLYRDLVPPMTRADARRRSDLLGQLGEWSAAARTGDPADRALSIRELGELAASPLVTIGAHTVTHTQLSALSDAEQRREILDSKRQLEAWLGREITVFSYPYGRRCHYTRKSVALCREAGFSKSAANFPGQAHSWSDPFQVPRHLVRDWPVGEFAARLEGFWTR